MICAVISLKYSEIPRFLHDSAFYKSLNDDGSLDNDISIPAECFKEDDTVTTVSELAHILHVDRFWGFDCLPVSILDFCFRMEKSRQRRTTILELSGQFPTLLEIRSVFGQEHPLVASITYDRRPDVMDYLIKATVDTKGTAASAAASLGNLHLLTAIHVNGHHWNEDTCSCAAAGGYIDCLIYAHENGCLWDYRTFASAATGGHLECIQYAHKNGLEWDTEVPRMAARYNQLACLQFMLENGCGLNVCITYEAASQGHTECLEYALRRGCPIYSTACLLAVRGGYIQCLQLLHQYGAPWDEEVAAEAASYGRMDCLQYLHLHGCPWDDMTTDYAVRYGHLECLQYAIEHGCPYGNDILIPLVQYGDLASIRYIVGLRSAEQDVFVAAMKRGKIDCLEYIVEQNFPFGDFTEDDLSYDVENHVWTDDNERDAQFLLCIQYAEQRGWKMNDCFVKFVEINQDYYPLSWQYVAKCVN